MERYNVDEDFSSLSGFVGPSPDMDDEAKWKLYRDYLVRQEEINNRRLARVEQCTGFCKDFGARELLITAGELWKYAVGMEGTVDDEEGGLYFNPKLNTKVIHIVGKLGLQGSFEDLQLLTTRCIKAINGQGDLMSIEALDASVELCKDLIASFPAFEIVYEDQVKSIRYYDMLKGKDGVFGARSETSQPLITSCKDKGDNRGWRICRPSVVLEWFVAQWRYKL